MKMKKHDFQLIKLIRT